VPSLTVTARRRELLLNRRHRFIEWRLYRFINRRSASLPEPESTSAIFAAARRHVRALTKIDAFASIAMLSGTTALDVTAAQ